MKYFTPEKNNNFIGRKMELERLDAITKNKEASVIVVYGRRRVGKTELIEQYFIKNKILKFEGVQPDSKKIRSSDEEKIYQINNCLQRLGKYVEREKEFSLMAINSWSSFFDLLIPYLKKGTILYFEEMQWLANYQDEFLAELKPYWDDHLRHIERLRIVFSGSMPSFIMGQFLSNSAFYNRSENFVALAPFNLMEINEYLRKGRKEVLLAAITTGGVCEYLKQLKNDSSIYQGLVKKSFQSESFFNLEYEKIFVSSLASNKYYKKIVEYLANVKYAARDDIAKHVVGKIRLGGDFTKLLSDLETCGFIKKYVPIMLEENSLLSRYSIADEYLQFYFKFIAPVAKQIKLKKYDHDPLSAINSQDFLKIMGFAFERWCCKNEMLFAKIMNFGNVEYQVGPFFNRQTTISAPGFQIDLMYIRKDHKIIICEIKYYQDQIKSKAVVSDVINKIEKFKEYNVRYQNYTYETALITTEGVAENFREHFDHIITFNEIFDSINWPK